jgi:DNA invertase Pin-like site-specific DNA recombinase
MATTRGNRAVIYVRESLDRWGDERAVERFEEQCRQLVKVRGLTEVRPTIKDNDVRASNGNHGDGYAEVLRMLRARETDYVVIPVVDRFFRSLRDLEDVIDICLETGAALVAASGEIDLSHDQGRLVARLLTSVAKAETERKGARQRAANDQAAKAGKRRTGGPRPFGWKAEYATVDDPKTGKQLRVRRFTRDDREADAIEWAAGALLGGASVSAVMREWRRRGLVTAQGGKPPTRQSVITIMRNPRNAGLSPMPGRDGQRHGEIAGAGEWEPILPEQTWRAVDALLGDPGRKPPRGVRSLLGGLAACPCGNVVEGGTNHLGHHVYRCRPATRDGRPGPHVAVRAEPVDEFTERVVLHVLSSGDLADLVTPPPHADTAGLRAQAAAIRANLDSMAADRIDGLVSRSQMIAATERGNARLAEIAAELAEAAGAGALAPFTRGQAAAQVWDGLDLSRRREVIRALAAVTLLPAGRGAREFDARKVRITSPAGENLASELTAVLLTVMLF